MPFNINNISEISTINGIDKVLVEYNNKVYKISLDELATILNIESPPVNTEITSTTFDEAQQLFQDAYKREKKVKIIMAGDSVNSYGGTDMVGYMKELLFQLNVEVRWNSLGGLSADLWQNDGTPTYMENALGYCIGENGGDTIMVWDLFINTWYEHKDDPDPVAATFADCDTALAAFLSDPRGSACKIVLRSPISVFSYTELKNVTDTVIEMLIAKYGFGLISGFTGTKHTNSIGVAGNAFRADQVHQRNPGARRIINTTILDQLVPLALAKKVIIPELDPIETETALIEFGVVTHGWKGNPTDTLRGIQDIPVQPYDLWKIKHGGDRTLIWFNSLSGGDNQIVILVDLPNTTDYWLVEVPTDCDTMHMEIAVDGVAYDLLGDVVTVHNVVPLLTYGMPISKINEGAGIRY